MRIPALELDLAYRECEEITRREAANFYYGIRLLAREKRQAMCAVYAFARRIDDIGDEEGEPQAKLLELQAERAKLAAIAAGSDAVLHAQGDHGADPVMVALAGARERFEIPLDALEDLIEGVEQDVREATYETFEDLVGYCRCVAGSIGRLCLAIFNGGAPSERVDGLADDLGVAMQLTNILRDVREDWGNGRVYLPAEDLQRFGCADPTLLTPELVRFEAQRAREWFDRGLLMLDDIDDRSAACVLAMTGIYRRILDRIEANPGEILEHRISLPPWEKAWLTARSLAGVRG
jgi:15-cis-phytoene synthase